MDINLVSILITTIIAASFFVYSLLGLFRRRDTGSLLLFGITLGMLFTYLFGFIRVYYYDLPDMDLFFWRLSGLGAGLSLTSFIIMFFWINQFSKWLERVVYYFSGFYFGAYALVFLLMPATKVVSSIGYSDWSPSLPIAIFIYIGAAGTLLSASLSLYFGLKIHNLKPVLFSISVFLTLIGLSLDGVGLVEQAIIWRLMTLAGIALMFYSSYTRVKKKR